MIISFSWFRKSQGAGRNSARLALATLAFLLPASAALAQTVTYECRVTPFRSVDEFWGGFTNIIQPQMKFIFEADRVIVDDPVVRGAYGGPIEGELTENTEKKWVVRWRVAGSGFNLRRATFMFRAAYLIPRNELIVTQAIPTYNTTFEGRGSCVAFQGGGS